MQYPLLLISLTNSLKIVLIIVIKTTKMANKVAIMHMASPDLQWAFIQPKIFSNCMPSL